MASPRFSHEAGFYDDPFDLTIESYLNRSIVFHLDAAVQEPQGFTLSIPLQYYHSGGATITLASVDDSAALQWRVFCGKDENSYQEIAVERAEFTGGVTRLSFDLSDEQLDNYFLDIRVEAVAEKSPCSFSLRSFRLYGTQMDPSLAQAHEYARMVKEIGADARYYPDFAQMSAWSAAKIEKETVALREQLQAALTEEALTTVGALDRGYPAWEKLEDYPAVVVDDRLIQGFYNEDEIILRGAFGSDMLLQRHKAVENDIEAGSDHAAIVLSAE